MIKKEKKVFKDGSSKTYIKVVEGYRPGPKLPPKQRTIRSFGYLEDQEDPVAFMEEVRKFDASFKADSSNRIEFPANALMYHSDNKTYNYGYKFLFSVLDLLDLDSFFSSSLLSLKARNKYSATDIFKFLVISRILNPDSKRADIQRRDLYYGLESEFALQDIYRSLDIFDKVDSSLQKHIHEKISALTHRDLSYAFYDVTNYYTEIDFPDSGDDGLRKRGVSKEHRVDPIVQMGLFIDSNGIPISMKTFPGNTSDCLTLQPSMEDVRKTYNVGRMIVVADKGLNSGKNLDYICNRGDGYVVSQILRGTKGKRYHEKLFDDKDWVVINKDYKYKLFEETYIGHDENGKKVERQRKVLIYYNGADARMMARKRAEKVKRAEKATANNAYGIEKGKEAYLKKNIVDKSTGEVLENTKTVLTVNHTKIEEEARFDGYFCLITSETEYDAKKIREVYGGLWRIEQSFRIMKSDLNARPLYVWKKEHIRAHFLICYVALIVVRMIQYYMGEDRLSPERLARALNAATCKKYRGGIIHLDDVGGMMKFQKINGKDTLVLSTEDEVAEDYKMIQKYFHTDFYYIYPKIEVFHRFLSSITPLEHNRKKP